MIHSGSTILRDFLAHPVKDEIPKGWMTAAQLVEKTGRGASTIGKVLRKGLGDGTIERRAFRVLCKDGDIRAVPHYFIKK